MPVSMDRATVANKKDEKKEKLTPGQHICRLVDMVQKETRKGDGFFLEFEVVEGPTPAGFRDTQMYFPDNVDTSKSKLSRQDLVDRENGKIQVAVAAVMGFSKAARHNVTTERLNKVTCHPRAPSSKVVSPLAGALFVVNAIPRPNNPEETYYYEFFPLPEGYKAPGAPSAPAVPPAPPVAAKPKAVFPPAPWVIHPDNDDYVWNAETNELKLVIDFKQELGVS